MGLIADMQVEIEHLIEADKTHYPDQIKWRVVYDRTRVMVWCRRKEIEHEDGRELHIQYHTTTHWSSPVSIYPDGEVNWSAGGKCSDAQPIEVAEAFVAIWEDVRRLYIKDEKLRAAQAARVRA